MYERSKYLLLSLTVAAFCINAKADEASPVSKEFYKPLPAPAPAKLLLKKHDRLAICGDSITEQKLYSRIIEDYLTVCAPQLDVTVRQFGWSGERAPGFLARMTNDCLRFNPTIATTCYGMNDFAYQPYQDWVGQRYQSNLLAIVQSFKSHGVRTVIGSSGCVAKIPPWAADKARTNPEETVENLNLSLCTLRNIGIGVSQKEKTGFADVFWPMLTAVSEAKNKFGGSYDVCGPDGVHPHWAGHTIMAYAFLKAMGLDGDIGVFTVDLAKNKMNFSKGHKLDSSVDGSFQITSSRYPFCACVPASAGDLSYPACETDSVTNDASIQSGMSFVPFNQDLNRLMLVAKNGAAQRYKVAWGDQSKVFSSEQLAQGINLAEEFPENPFSVAFAKVDAAVAAKQAFETKQIKEIFRSASAQTNMEAVVAASEETRRPLAEAIQTAFVPVTHTITITAE